MKYARESWGIGHGVHLGLLSALYVRDTLALSVDTRPHVPGLIPSLPVLVPVGVDRAAVAREWPGWWDDAVRACVAGTHPINAENAEALVTRPACRAAVVALRDGIERLHQAQAPVTLPISEVVSGVRARFGEPAQAVQLNIAELPVAGMLWERLGPTQVMASTWFLNDPAVAAPALRAVLEDLVRIS